MSPLERTTVFAREYDRAFRSTFQSASAIELNLTEAEFATLFEMRQSADRRRMSYPRYLEICFSLYRKKDPAKFRRPHRVFIDGEESKTWRKRKLKLAQEREDAEFLKLASVDAYQAENYRALPAQDRLRRLVIDRAKRSRRWERIAEKFCVESTVVPLATLIGDLKGTDRAELKTSLIANVSSGRVVRRPPSPIGSDDLMQGCFGWPPAATALSNDQCLACQQRIGCRAIAVAASA